jgi:hypothetical protein
VPGPYQFQFRAADPGISGAHAGHARASVTVAAGALQKAGLITYQRGQVNIVDRPQRESAACECYEMIEQQSKKCQAK